MSPIPPALHFHVAQHRRRATSCTGAPCFCPKDARGRGVQRPINIDARIRILSCLTSCVSRRVAESALDCRDVNYAALTFKDLDARLAARFGLGPPRPWLATRCLYSVRPKLKHAPASIVSPATASTFIQTDGCTHFCSVRLATPLYGSAFFPSLLITEAYCAFPRRCCCLLDWTCASFHPNRGRRLRTRSTYGGKWHCAWCSPFLVSSVPRSTSTSPYARGISSCAPRLDTGRHSHHGTPAAGRPSIHL